MQTENSSTLAKYVSDMVAAENLLLNTVKSQASDAKLTEYPEVTALLFKTRSLTEAHLSGLDHLIEALEGKSRSAVKATVTAVTGTVLGTVGHLRTHNVSKLLRDDYTTLSLHAIGYSMLHATGLALAAPEVASLSLSYLKDVAELIMEISQAVLPVVVQELSETDTVVFNASEMACENVRSAWQNA